MRGPSGSGGAGHYRYCLPVDQQTAPAEHSAPPRRRRTGLIVGLAILVLGICVGTVGGLRFRADYTTFVPTSRSMSSTLSPGDRALFHLTTQAGPRRGDVVLFVPGTWHDLAPGTELVQRVIGIAGDTVACCDDHDLITVNGHAVTEDYVHPDPTTPATGAVHLPFRATVPKGTVFVAGDDRGDSFDSRFRGPVAVSDVLGIAVTDVSIGGYRQVPPTNAFVAAGLPGAATRDGAYLLDPALLLTGVLLVLVGLVWLLVIGLRAALRRGPGRSPAVTS
jgi:signal peptidase I